MSNEKDGPTKKALARLRATKAPPRQRRRTYSLKLPEIDYPTLRETCRIKGVSVSDVIVDLITELLDSMKDDPDVETARNRVLKSLSRGKPPE